VTGRKQRASGSPDPEMAPRISAATGDRFPGFNVLDQARYWDPVTAGVVLARIGRLPGIRFFTPAEEAAATALCDRLLGQDGEPKVSVVPQIDARLAEQQTDGWRYADMPEDGQAWRSSLLFLDEDSQDLCASEFALASAEDQQAIIQAVHDLGSKEWHGLNAAHVWSLWTRYAGTAFYGVEPSGEPVVINGTAVLRMRDGKIVEHWGGPHCQDGVGLTH